MKVTDMMVILPDYNYTTPPFNGIVENEFCPVYLARIDSDISPNPEEVVDYKWMDWSDFVSELHQDAKNNWSFWCKDQVNHFNKKTLSDYLNTK
jgi:isopentenyl-diphosphate delta-isomerase